MKTSKEQSEHYFWGEKCSGWHLLKSTDLSIIQELMPPQTAEVKHKHQLAQQFFFILKGTAHFIIENEPIQLEAGEGLHIKPQIKHQIKNESLEPLEFLVISQPTTRGDRINISNIPFEEEPPFNLNNKKFRSLQVTDNGEVDENTLFHYRQNKDIIWGTYQGGDIKFGTLNGRVITSKDENQIPQTELEFVYQQENTQGEFMSGRCHSKVVLINGKIRLLETWQWTSGDLSKGTSIVEEI